MVKRLFAIVLLLVMAFNSSATAEEMAEYADNMFSFKYPATWDHGVADNGDIVLTSPDGKNAILAFALIVNFEALQFAGDEDKDAPIAENYISQYGGKNLELNGEYDFIESGEMKGFRAYGKWRETGQDATMVVLTGEDHMVGFVMVGTDAVALEDELLSSVELLGDIETPDQEGLTTWKGGQFSISYPNNYGVMDTGTGVAFINSDDVNNIIMVRAYTLDVEYTDDLAPAIAAAYLPKSTHVAAEPEMVEVGDRNAAVIRGELDAGPMEFYVLGEGRTALAVFLTGEESVGMAESIVTSAEFFE